MESAQGNSLWAWYIRKHGDLPLVTGRFMRYMQTVKGTWWPCSETYSMHTCLDLVAAGFPLTPASRLICCTPASSKLEENQPGISFSHRLPPQPTVNMQLPRVFRFTVLRCAKYLNGGGKEVQLHLDVHSMFQSHWHVVISWKIPCSFLL